MTADASVLKVSLGNLVANWQTFAARCPQECGATVKANAYGTGIDRAAPALAEAGCNTFFVATLSEALTLRAILPSHRIFVFSGLDRANINTFIEAKISPVLNTAEQLASWANAQTDLASALHIDTAMSRLGCDPREIKALAADTARLENANVAFVMSHLACADEPGHSTNARQTEYFEAIKQAFGPLPVSFGNSAGILNGPDFTGDIGRPGIGLYGGNPRPGLASPLLDVVEWIAPLLQCRTIAAGEPVGYGSAFVADKDMVVGTVGAGYADGLPRAIAGKAQVYVNGNSCAVLGRISMDSHVIDLSKVGPQPYGTRVQLLGETSVTQMAEWAGTISYEILTGISSRVARTYTQP